MLVAKNSATTITTTCSRWPVNSNTHDSIPGGTWLFNLQHLMDSFVVEEYLLYIDQPYVMETRCCLSCFFNEFCLFISSCYTY